MNDLNMARKWAKASEATYMGEYERAAAEAILSLPDEWIDAEKVREALEGCDKMTYPYEVIKHIEKSLLAPRPRTLADMTHEEREACQWMQADVKLANGGSATCVIANPRMPGAKVRVWAPHGGSDDVEEGRVTPLPDLPKLVWPSLSVSGESEAVSVETEESEGLPRPEDVLAGEPWIVEYDGHKWVGTRDSRDRANWPWVLARLDGINCCTARDSDITLMSRLVPEVTP